MLLALSIAALLVQSSPAAQAGAPARNPAYARDGRLAVSVRGDLWIVSPRGEWIQLTRGPAWDREPAWTPDGSAIVFSSDRSGNFDLWRVSVTATGAATEPERITSSPLFDGQPTVASDGRIVFVRGRLAAASIWVRQSNGTEARLDKGTDAEQWPAISPDGRRVAYVSIGDGARKLVVRDFDDDSSRTVLSDPRIEHPAWSPGGDRITWTATGPRGAVYVSPLDGRYTNLVSTHHAESAWKPDGKTITLAEIPIDDGVAPVAYNGDPDRTSDREANLLAPAAGRMWTVDAPSVPDQQLVEQAGSAPSVDRARQNGDAFDQLWQRTASLYYSTPDAAARRERWVALKAKYRPRALAAKNDDELKSVLHDLLREHPP